LKRGLHFQSILISATLELGTITAEWKSPDSLDKVFGNSTWRRRRALAKDGCVPTTAAILIGPYDHSMPCVTPDGRPGRKIVVKYNTFRIDIKRLPKSGGHNRDYVRAEFKIDRFGIIKKSVDQDLDKPAPAPADLDLNQPAPAPADLDLNQPTPAPADLDLDHAPVEPRLKRHNPAALESDRLKRHQPAALESTPVTEDRAVPLLVVAETWGPTTGRSKFHQRYLHVQFSDGATLPLVAEDLHPTRLTPSSLVESNPFYTCVVDQWRLVHPHPVLHPNECELATRAP
jgi:hypothetical protein